MCDCDFVCERVGDNVDAELEPKPEIGDGTNTGA